MAVVTRVISLSLPCRQNEAAVRNDSGYEYEVETQTPDTTARTDEAPLEQGRRKSVKDSSKNDRSGVEGTTKRARTELCVKSTSTIWHKFSTEDTLSENATTDTHTIQYS